MPLPPTSLEELIAAAAVDEEALETGMVSSPETADMDPPEAIRDRLRLGVAAPAAALRRPFFLTFFAGVSLTASSAEEASTLESVLPAAAAAAAVVVFFPLPPPAADELLRRLLVGLAWSTLDAAGPADVPPAATAPAPAAAEPAEATAAPTPPPLDEEVLVPAAASSFFFCSALSMASKAFMIISIFLSSLDLALFLSELEAS